MNTFLLVIVLISGQSADGDVVGLMDAKMCADTAKQLIATVTEQDHDPRHKYQAYCIDTKTGVIKPAIVQQEAAK